MSSLSESRSPSVISLRRKPAVIRAGRWLLTLGSTFAIAWRAHRRRAVDRDILMSMSAHELSDLGLGRGEIPCITAGRKTERRRD